MEDPFILVVEGSIPNEKNKSEGYWASFGTGKATGHPIIAAATMNKASSPKSMAAANASLSWGAGCQWSNATWESAVGWRVSAVAPT
jgi:hypothetical protein